MWLKSVRALQREPDALWGVDRDKASCRVEVILAALIDYAEVTKARGIGIGQGPIDLVQFEGGWIVGIVDADDVFGAESENRWGHVSLNGAFPSVPPP